MPIGSASGSSEAAMPALDLADDSFFFADINKAHHPRSKSVRGTRSEMLIDEGTSTTTTREKTKPTRRSSQDLSQSQIPASAFNRRKGDRSLSLGADMGRPPTFKRQFVNGVPLLADLNEILNLDVITMAMKEQESRKSRHKRRKVLPEKDEKSDPSIYVEERISFHSTDQDLQQEEQKEEESKEQLGPEFYIDIENQVAARLRRDFTEPEDDDSCSDDSDSDGSANGEDEEQAHRLAMEMMLSGEHPDTEID